MNAMSTKPTQNNIMLARRNEVLSKMFDLGVAVIAGAAGSLFAHWDLGVAMRQQTTRLRGVLEHPNTVDASHTKGVSDRS